MSIYDVVDINQGNVSDIDGYLGPFRNAGDQMRKACDGLLVLIPQMPSEDDRDHFKRLHKRMVRMRREWNRLEQQRDTPPAKVEGKIIAPNGLPYRSVCSCSCHEPGSCEMHAMPCCEPDPKG